MDQVKKHVITHQDKFKFLLFAGTGVAAFNTLARPDFNLILYLYLFYIWKFMENSVNQSAEKLNSFFILVFSLGIDLIWTIYWGGRWGSLKNDDESLIHGLVIFFSWFGILLKIVTIISIGILEWGNIKSSLPEKLQEKLNASNNYQEQKDDPEYAA